MGIIGFVLAWVIGLCILYGVIRAAISSLKSSTRELKGLHREVRGKSDGKT